MLTTTFKRLKEAGACESGYKKLGEALGGITAYGKDTPITLLQILESNGLDDALWAFKAVAELEDGKRIARLFACDCAERVLHIFEREHPHDKRPRQAIEVARQFAVGEATEEEIAAAWDAARDATDVAWDAARDATDVAWDAARAAAWDAARDAARAAAWDVAWDAEQKAQKQILINLLK
jgi:hypothetical protein